jgi:hypothetical protein
MAKMWVQLTQKKNVEVLGKMKTYSAGDWVAVGKQTAMLWISEGSAWVPEGKAVDLMGANCGVLILGNESAGKVALGDYVGKIEIDVTGRGTLPERLPWPKTLLYNPLLKLRKELVPIGFHLLDTWQMAVPLWDYNDLASMSGEEEDRERTAAVLPDLRVPLYSPDLIFIRRCGDTDAFLQAWRDDDEGDRRYSFLRALYRSKPLVLALPTTWIGKDRGIGG